MDIAILSNSLELIKKIHIKDDIENTCNFIIPSNMSYYISCQSVILKVAKVCFFTFVFSFLFYLFIFAVLAAVGKCGTIVKGRVRSQEEEM